MKSGQDFWPDAAPWKAVNTAQDILIPLEIANGHLITGFVVLNDSRFPEGGQRTLFDYAGYHFRESCATLTIHRTLGNAKLEDGYTIALLKLAYSIDHCNTYSHNHAVKTAFWARKIAEKVGFDEEQLSEIELTSKLHDVGKIVVPKSILTKPAQLSDEDWMVMRRHPTFGAMIMKPSARLRSHIPIVNAHHEKFDGSGYPDGLEGEQIPLQARIISVADTFATMTEGRVYREPSSRVEALREIIRFSGRQFDPDIVSVMVDLVTTGEVDDSQCRWGFN